MKKTLAITGLCFLVGLLVPFLLPDLLKWIRNLSISELGIFLLILWVTIVAAGSFFSQAAKNSTKPAKSQNKSQNVSTDAQSVGSSSIAETQAVEDVLPDSATIRRLEPRPNQTNTTGFVVTQVFLLAIMVGVLFEFPGVHERLGIKFHYHPITSFVAGLMIYVAIYATLGFLQHLLGTKAQAELISFSVLRKFWPRKKHSKILLLVALCLLNPVTEEFVFRGVIVFLLGTDLEKLWLSASIGLILSMVFHLYQGSSTLFFQTLFHGTAIVILFSKLGLIGCIGYHFAGDLLPVLNFLRTWRKAARIHCKAVSRQRNTRMTAIESYLLENPAQRTRSEWFHLVFGFAFAGLILSLIFFIAAPIVSANADITPIELKLIALVVFAAYLVLANHMRKKVELTSYVKISDSPDRQTNIQTTVAFVQLMGLFVFLVLLIRLDYDIQTLLGFTYYFSQWHGFGAGFLIMLAISSIYRLVIEDFLLSGVQKIRAYENHKARWPRDQGSKHLALVTGCILAPVIEEILLRGVLVHLAGQLSGAMMLSAFLGLLISYIIASRESQGAGMIFYMIFTACSIGLTLSPLGLSASIGAGCAYGCVSHWVFLRRWLVWVSNYQSTKLPACGAP